MRRNQCVDALNKPWCTADVGWRKRCVQPDSSVHADSNATLFNIGRHTPNYFSTQLK